jgi:energy-coupling factor transporter ATP-binding protein EcfA2
MNIKFVDVNGILNITIKEKLINIITGSNKDIIYNLLIKKEDYEKGQIIIKNKDLKGINKKQLEKIFGPFNLKLTTKGKIDNNLLKMLKDFNLNEKILVTKYENLSLSEKQKIRFISLITLNPDVLLLNNPSYGLNDQDKKTMIRYIKEINFINKKTIIVISDDCEFNNKIAQNIIYYDNDQVIFGLKDEIYKKNLFRLDEMSEFINKLNQKGLHFMYRTEISDLAKDIYRRIT